MIEEKKIKYKGVKGIPHSREPGSAIRHKTGDWRVFKPIIDHSRCIKCKTCFTFCPDAAIKWINKKPAIDYTMCKGCGICSEECPVKCIKMVRDLHEELK